MSFIVLLVFFRNHCFGVFSPLLLRLLADNRGAGGDGQSGSQHILQHLLGMSLHHTTLVKERHYKLKSDSFLSPRYGSPSGPSTAPCATAASPSSTTTARGWATALVRPEKIEAPPTGAVELALPSHLRQLKHLCDTPVIDSHVLSYRVVVVVVFILSTTSISSQIE